MEVKLIKTHLSKDPLLAPLINALEFPVFDPNRTVFSSLISSIVSQQLSVKAAATIHGRFLDLFPDQQLDAERILAFDLTDLRAVGLSRQKSTYIQNVAEYFLEHKLMDVDWEVYSDHEIIELLTQIKGVGKWTVEMVLMFTLYRSNILPVDDLGIQQAFAGLYKIDLSQKKKTLFAEMERISKPWEPYRSIACIYLWRWKDSLN